MPKFPFLETSPDGKNVVLRVDQDEQVTLVSRDGAGALPATPITLPSAAVAALANAPTSINGNVTPRSGAFASLMQLSGNAGEISYPSDYAGIRILHNGFANGARAIYENGGISINSDSPEFSPTVNAYVDPATAGANTTPWVSELYIFDSCVEEELNLASYGSSAFSHVGKTLTITVDPAWVAASAMGITGDGNGDTILPGYTATYQVMYLPSIDTWVYVRTGYAATSLADLSPVGAVAAATITRRQQQRSTSLVNLHSTGDKATISGLPAKYILDSVRVYGASVTPVLCQLEVRTAASGGGTALTTAGTITTLTSAAKVQALTVTDATTYKTATALYVYCTVANAAALSAAVVLEYTDLT
jgi:hypothetical protein